MPFDGATLETLAVRPAKMPRWKRMIYRSLGFRVPSYPPSQAGIEILTLARRMITRRENWQQGFYHRIVGSTMMWCSIGALRGATVALDALWLRVAFGLAAVAFAVVAAAYGSRRPAWLGKRADGSRGVIVKPRSGC